MIWLRRWHRGFRILDILFIPIGNGRFELDLGLWTRTYWVA